MNTAINDMLIETMVKLISFEALSAVARRIALLQVPRHVLDHDDGVVDHESCRYRQRHQRQVVEAVPIGYMTAKVPISDSGTVMLGMRVARKTPAGTGKSPSRRGRW